jgi:hypothetical protein
MIMERGIQRLKSREKIQKAQLEERKTRKNVGSSKEDFAEGRLA